MPTDACRLPSRRAALLAAAAWIATAAALPSRAAAADAWPTRPIHLVVPFAPGGANDLIARAAAEGMSKRLGQQVIVDNKPGAGAMVGAAFVAKAAPDGYTFLASAAGIVSNSMIKKEMPYKDDELVPVVMVGLAPSVIVVPADSPYKTLKDFIEASKKGAGFRWATAGTGSTPHFVGGLLSTYYGAKLEMVPYKSGAESVTAVMGAQIEGTSEASVAVLPNVKGGKLRALATTWTERIKAYPQLPTATEEGFPKVQIAHWCGIHAPKGTPAAILDKVAAAVDAAMKDPAAVAKLEAAGIQPVGGTRADFVKFNDEERARLSAVVKATGMKAD
ncbi:MAG: tripartite tricarboxylate transporter substrate binding protein [Proteobacteria bacterium]|nr:tripartite tricarboxylate transporter substrate binding protein [Pseudomonadota bacterium]